jgi:signal transduction histidine kinase
VPETLLIIDDEPLLRMNLRAMLEDLGYRVLEAGNGAEGLETCARERPDLVLLDIRMPGMCGLEVCACMGAQESTRGIPVVFLSGLMETDEKVKAFQAGAVDYVTKPFHIEEVQARVRSHLDLRRQRTQLKTSVDELSALLAQTELLNQKLVDLNEKLRVSEELKGHFLDRMRNEINDPLGSILGLAAEIAKGRLPPEQAAELAALIGGEAASLEFKLRNVFCAADLEAGEAIPTLARVPAASVLRDALDSFRAEARARSVELAWDEASLEGLEVVTDPAKLRLILANLLSNALKFSPPGSTVRVEATLQDPCLLLQVQDEGPGIPEQDWALVFQPFHQLDGGLARAHGGQGLGLPVARALADLLGGQLWLTSEPGRGACFFCRVPCTAGSEDFTDSALDGNLFFFDNDPEA